MSTTEDKTAGRTRKPRSTPRASESTATPVHDAPSATPTAATDDDRAHRIAETAYFLAEARGFAPGGEVDDWLAAERLVDAGARS